MNTNHEHMCAVICVKAMLHNVAAKAGAALGEPEEEEDEDNDEEERCEDDLPQNYVGGVATRRTVILFSNRSLINTNHHFAP